MLPAPVRMRASRQFDATVRGGVRVSRPSLVVHLRLDDEPTQQFGFVVSRKVGNAVQRNRVKRRLRHLVAAQREQTPPGVWAVVRALPNAAVEPGRLESDLVDAWQTGLRRLARSR